MVTNARKNDGGPAFPWEKEDPTLRTPDGNYLRHPVPGMTLRDWFAGVWAGSQKYHYWSSSNNVQTLNAIEAESAYKFADAMLAERSKGDDDGGQ